MTLTTNNIIAISSSAGPARAGLSDTARKLLKSEVRA